MNLEDVRNLEVEAEDRESSPEARLWNAVLLQAWEDSFSHSDCQLSAGEDKAADPDLIRGEARRFLCASLDPWRSDREEVCSLAGVDPNMIQAAARKRLELSREEDAEREAEARERSIARLDDMLARLLDRSEDLHPGRLDQQLRKLAEIESATV